MGLFDKNAFNSAREEVAGVGDWVNKIDNGFYLAELRAVKMGLTQESKKPYLKLIWHFTADCAEDLRGRPISQAFYLMTNAGERNDVAYKGIAINCSQLKVDLSDAESDDAIEAAFKDALGSVARLHVTTKDDYLNIRIKKVIRYGKDDAGSSASSPNDGGFFGGDGGLKGLPAPADDDDEAVEIGMTVLVTRDNGDFTAKVTNIDYTSGLVEVKYLSTGEIEKVSPDKLAVTTTTPEMKEQMDKTSEALQEVTTVEEVSVIEELTDIKPVELEEGMTVEGMCDITKVRVTGTVYTLDADTVKIKVGNKAHPCARSSVNVIT